MRHILHLAAAWALCSGIAFSQAIFPTLAPDSIPRMHVLSDRSFDGSSLWGYIDGGADVYLEYGFDKVRTMKLEIDSVHYLVDLYRMNDAASAFGIFSISTNACDSVDAFPDPHCASRYQMQFARGSYYVSIANDKGTPQAQRMGIRLARLLSAQIAPATIDWPRIFALDALTSSRRTMKFIKGRLGLQNGFAAWEDLFDDLERYDLSLLTVASGADDITVAHVAFADAHQMGLFSAKAGVAFPDGAPFQQHERDGMVRCAWKGDGWTLILLEAKSGTQGMPELIQKISGMLQTPAK